LLALSVIETLPEAVPAEMGVYWTFSVQEAPTAIEPGQLLVWEKAPVVAMLVTVSDPLPLFVSVTLFAALVVSTDCDVKVSEVGDNVTAGAPIPVPLSVITCGLPTTSSVTLIFPASVPVTEGVKVTLMVQAAPGATELPQVLV
jgi:hypothetical protein